MGERVVAALGEPAARELLGVLERSDADRAALIGRLHVRDDAEWLAELLIDLEDEVGEIARLRLLDALRSALPNDSRVTLRVTLRLSCPVLDCPGTN